MTVLRHYFDIYQGKPFFSSSYISMFAAFCCIHWCIVVVGQNNIGIPKIKNYSKKTYQAGTQNWDIVQDHQGILYFANNEGLLSFDGTNWNLYPLPNHTIVRSLTIDSSGLIYVGGQGEFGYFKPNEIGELTYHSLVHLIPKDDQSFDDIWSIEQLNDQLFFQTNQEIYIYDKKTIQVLPFENQRVEFIGAVYDKLFIQNDQWQLFHLDGDNLKEIAVPPTLKSVIANIHAVGPNKSLIVTLWNGLFLMDNDQITPINTPADSFFKTQRLFASCKLRNGHYAFGTSLGGIIVLDQNLQVREFLDKQFGLQNNNILNLFLDKSQNLWLGLDNGIDRIAIHAPFRYVFPDDDTEGTGYTSILHQEKLYLGTSSGLYSIDWKNYYNPLEERGFESIQNASGQVYSLTNINEELFMGHHEGPFQIIDGQAARLDPMIGAWNFLPYPPDRFILGHYTGLSIFEKKNNQWSLEYSVPEFRESSRILMQEGPGKLWIAHPYKGLYHIEMESDTAIVNYYAEGQGLPSKLFNHVYSIADRPVFTAEEGIYQFNEETGDFRPMEEFNEVLGQYDRIKYLEEDRFGNIWFVADEVAGYIKVTDLGLKKKVEQYVFPELTDKLVGGFENIYVADERNVFLGAEKGFIHFDPIGFKQVDTSINVIMREVRLIASQDSILFAGSTTPQHSFNQDIELQSHQNNIRFAFSAPFYRMDVSPQYQSRLEGWENEWSTWSSKTEKEYTNLPAGLYTFYIRAKNPYGVISEPQMFTFEIAPPWYASGIAYTIYSVFFFGAILGLISFQRSRFETEKAALESQHQKKEEEAFQKVEQTERALMQLSNEKLEAEIQYKTQELASATMHLVQKGEILNRIQEELQRVIKDPNDKELIVKEIKRIIKLLQADRNLDDNWEQFAYHFDQVHSDFLKRLREKYPDLTTYDHKLCAYLRMNLSTKEIASLMNISVRGVEGSRYRLRKKLEIPGKENLVQYLMEI